MYNQLQTLQGSKMTVKKLILHGRVGKKKLKNDNAILDVLKI